MDLQAYLDQLRSLDQNNIGSWPLWAHVGAIIIVVAFILGAGTWYFVLPRTEVLAEAQQQEQSLRAELKRKQRKVANLDAYKKQLAKMQQAFTQLLRQLPNESEVPELVSDISQLRQASGLKEKLFKPRPTIKRDFYAVLPYDLRVVGSFHELGRFVSRVASLPRIVTLDDITIRRVMAGGAFTGKLRMSVVLKTYRYLDHDDSGHES